MAKHINAPLNWERLGKHGHPMVFVHPKPTDLSCWAYQMAHFSTWFRTIAVDLPGYGRSPTTEPGLTMEDIADACWEAVDEVSPEPTVVVGISVGSSVAQHMAAMRPERTLALTITAGGYFPVTDQRYQAVIARSVEQYRSQGIAARRPKVFEGFAPDFAPTPLASYFADIFAERNDTADVETIVRMLELLGKGNPDWVRAGITSPTLIITGSADPGHQAHRQLQTLIAGARLAVMEGAGHCCNIERPWEYDAHLLGFLREVGLVEPYTASRSQPA